MKKITLLLTIIILFSIFSGCSTTGKTLSNTIDEKENTPNWKYEVEITHEGSRSQGSAGRLFFKNIEVPPVFDIIIIEKTVYKYKPMKFIWDDYGYIKSGLIADAPKITSNKITEKELARGWYEADPSKLKCGTPEDWIYIESSRINLRISPSRLDDASAFYELKTVNTEMLKLY